MSDHCETETLDSDSDLPTTPPWQQSGSCP